MVTEVISVAESKITQIKKSAEYWLFPSGPQEDITSQLNTSGAHYTVPEDCVIYVRYYGGFCELEGDLSVAFSNGSGFSSSNISTQPNRIKVICKKGAYLTMWLTGTVVDVIKKSCAGD